MSKWIAAIAFTGVGLVAPGTTMAQDMPSVEAVLATDVVDMMPVGEAMEFPADVGQVFCWTRVTGASGTSIQHVWMHDDMEFPVTLEVSGSPWRTWSSKTIPPEWAGEWTVEIRDAADNVLETLTFNVGM